MSLDYGVLKCRVVSKSTLKGSKKDGETQYHLLANLQPSADGDEKTWQCAINVGTNRSNDLLQYRLVFDYEHAMLADLRASEYGFRNLSKDGTLPALDYLRSDVLANTGDWRRTDPMDGSGQADPIPALERLLQNAMTAKADVYLFGHSYTGGDLGVHDIHMNQGSTGHYINKGSGTQPEANDVWQDGAVLVDLGEDQWSAYFTAFMQQLVPTDDLGNPVKGAKPITDSDPGSLAGEA